MLSGFGGAFGMLHKLFLYRCSGLSRRRTSDEKSRDYLEMKMLTSCQIGGFLLCDG